MKHYISAPIKYLSHIYLVIHVVIRGYTNAESVFSDDFVVTDALSRADM